MEFLRAVGQVSSQFSLQLDTTRKRTVNDKVGSGDETRRRTGQEHHRPRHFLRLSHAPRRIERHRLFEQLRISVLDLFPHAAREIRIPRRQRIDPDVARREKDKVSGRCLRRWR